MKLFFSLFLITFFAQASHAAAPSPSVYPYQASLNAAPLKQNQVLSVGLPIDVLQKIRADYGNLQVLDNLNGQPEFSVYSQKSKKVNKIASMEVSSENENFPANHLLDGNRLTSFSFDQKIDGKNPGLITFDFGKTVNLHRIEILAPFGADIKGMTLKHGLKKDALKTLKPRMPHQPVLDGDFPPFRYLEISLWGTNVFIDDLNFYKTPEATLYISAEPERRYRVLFGDQNVNNKRFKSRLDTLITADQIVTLAPYKFNALASDDFDKDGILNAEDNCPTVSNKSQQDEDEDKIGDPCDNAIEVKNYSQSDNDNDGVGDLIDNCKLVFNVDQKDKDNDQVGDECDDAYGKEKSSLINFGTSQQETPFPLWYALGVLTVFAGVYLLFKKKK